jgi:O-antigen/teichoic acid export membrane protein
MSTLLSSIIYLFSATVASKLFGVIKTFWLARVLDPADFGIWTIIFLISTYAPILNLGMGEALLKLVPFFLGKKDDAARRDVEGGVLSFSLILTAFLLPVILLLPRILSVLSLGHYALPAQLMLLAACFSFFSGFFTLRLQAYQRFPSFSAVTTARSIILLILQIGLSYVYGLTGAVLGFLLCEILICAYSFFLNVKMPYPLSIRVSTPLYGNLIRTGFPITIIWWTFIIQTSVDRILSMAMLGETQTGFYGISMSIATIFLMIPDTINQVLYPNVNKTYGQTSDKRSLIPLVIDPSRVMSLILPFFAFVALLLLPLLFQFIVPKYLPGLQTAQLLILAAIFNGMTKSGTNLLISISRQGRLIVFLLASILLNIAGNILLVKMGFGIEGIAVSTVITAALLAVMIWWSVLSSFHFTVRESVRYITNIFMPVVLYMVFFLADYVMATIMHAGPLVSSLVIFISFLLYWAVLLAIPSQRLLITQCIRTVLKALKSRRGPPNGIVPPVKEES